MAMIEIVAVGNELLSGDTLDTNFRALAQQLKEIGAEVRRHVTVGDVVADIAAAVRESLSRADVVVVTGGLGPTEDDRTRFGVAAALEADLVRDEPTLLWLRERFRSYGIGTMPPANEVQALFPAGAAILHNANGTAHGFRCERGRQAVFVLPGPPRELVPMIDRHLRPWFLARGGLTVVRVKRLRTQGIGESVLAERVAGLPHGVPGIEIGYYPQDPGVDLKLTARGSDPQQVEAALESAAGQMRTALGELLYGEGRVTLPEVLGRLLRERGETLALAESCTGGLAGWLVASVSGASDYFDGGVISYSNAAKEAWLSIPNGLIAAQGAVSAPVATAMAEQVRLRRGTTWGIGISGVAGPTGGIEEKPVGLVYIALAGPGGTEAVATRHAGERTTIQRRAAMTALDRLRRRILSATAMSAAESSAVEPEPPK